MSDSVPADADIAEPANQVVALTVTGSIATITLDSPRNRNALSTTLVDQLLAALRTCAGDADIRAVILTHTGGTFCAGADLSEALARGLSVDEAAAAGTQAMVAVLRTILELPKPVIARVDGHVRAGGLGLLGAADLVFAGPASTFALTEARLAVAPSVISIVLLPKMTARSSGRYYLTGERFDNVVAAQIGLITAGHGSVADLDADLAAAIDGINKAAPQGLAASKALTTASVLADLDRDADARAGESAALFGSDAARVGMTAFLSKQRPPWDRSSPTTDPTSGSETLPS